MWLSGTATGPVRSQPTTDMTCGGLVWSLKVAVDPPTVARSSSSYVRPGSWIGHPCCGFHDGDSGLYTTMDAISLLPSGLTPNQVTCWLVRTGKWATSVTSPDAVSRRTTPRAAR